ncbi:hypothetical protein XENOCAPTIV_016706 [Xenoophorus captivus]|uniref:Uncharacterized protein n=1 Tax=Xenoophorus captivus TaxID=1517983 RepID=A0ABV0SAC9_9TELE
MYTSVYTFHDVCRLRDLAAERCVCPWERVDVSVKAAEILLVLPRCGGRRCVALKRALPEKHVDLTKEGISALSLCCQHVYNCEHLCDPTNESLSRAIVCLQYCWKHRQLGGELFHVNIATVHHILGDADAAWGLVYCFEEHLFDPHQQMKSGLIKPPRQLRDEEIDNFKEPTPEVLLWIFPLMRCITIIITPWSASRWRECGLLNQAVHGCVLGFFKDAVECLGGSHVSVESGASVSLTALSLVTSLWTGERLPPPLQMRTLLKIP